MTDHLANGKIIQLNKDFFLSVDWGTSNFRLRLVRMACAEVIEERSSPVGIRELFSKWQQQGGEREDIFLDFLKQEINLLNSPVADDMAIVISGMASSNIGIKELPYSSLPFSIEGTGLHMEEIRNTSLPQKIFLISGVSSGSDVIRGEETQVLGLAGYAAAGGITVFILPGTHSKHIVCGNGEITGFRTFMTGELFQALSVHTILKTSIKEPLPGFCYWKEFEKGVRQSQEGFSLLNDLFSIRTRDILHRKTPQENYYYLSGLLIGEELRACTREDADQLVLCAGAHLFEPYERAAGVLRLDKQIKIVERAAVDNAVPAGQLKILDQCSAV